MAFPLEDDHFDHRIVTAGDGLVALALFYVDGLDLPVLGSDIDQVGVQHRAHNRTNHRVVLDQSLQEQAFDILSIINTYVLGVLRPYHIPDAQSVVQSAGDHLLSSVVQHYASH